MPPLWHLLFSPEKRRRKLLQSLPKDPVNAPLRALLEKPLPDRRRPVGELEFLALDFETTGLEPKEEAILSIGRTLIRNGRIVLAENRHDIVQVNRPLPEKSVVIHGITDDRMRSGIHLHEALESLLPAMAGRVLVVHHAPIEKKFLEFACQRIYGAAPPLLIVDTLEIERRKLARRGEPAAYRQLRLFNLRAQYNLPRYHAHNALEDALATAELFLAQVANAAGRRQSLRLSEVLAH